MRRAWLLALVMASCGSPVREARPPSPEEEPDTPPYVPARGTAACGTDAITVDPAPAAGTLAPLATRWPTLVALDDGRVVLGAFVRDAPFPQGAYKGVAIFKRDDVLVTCRSSGPHGLPPVPVPDPQPLNHVAGLAVAGRFAHAVTVTYGGSCRGRSFFFPRASLTLWSLDLDSPAASWVAQASSEARGDLDGSCHAVEVAQVDIENGEVALAIRECASQTPPDVVMNADCRAKLMLYARGVWSQSAVVDAGHRVRADLHAGEPRLVDVDGGQVYRATDPADAATLAPEGQRLPGTIRYLEGSHLVLATRLESTTGYREGLVAYARSDRDWRPVTTQLVVATDGAAVLWTRDDRWFAATAAARDGLAPDVFQVVDGTWRPVGTAQLPLAP